MENLTPEAVKSQIEDIAKQSKAAGEAFKAELTGALKDKAAIADVEAIKGKFHEFCEAQDETVKSLKETAEKQGAIIDDLQRKGSHIVTSFPNALKEALTANFDKLKAMKDNKSAAGVAMTVKAAAVMTTANILPTTGGAIPFSLASGGEMIGIQRRKPFLREIIGARATSSMYEYWVEQVNPDGVANVTAEGAAKSQVDFDFQERSAKVEKITAYSKMSKEVLADVTGMQNFVEEEIQTLVELKLDQQLYSGSGTSPQLKGLTQWATTMSVSSTPFALGVESANNFDVAVAAKSIMANSYFFEPNVMLINPLDYGYMQLLKSTQNEYIYPRWAGQDGMTIAGMRVYANPGIPSGDFIIMDTTKLRLRMREEFNIDYGYENDDFTKNLITVLGELRALLYLPTNYAGAVLKGTFATVRAAMETA